MSLDAIVWLVAGVGLGLGIALLLLVGYAALERLRLGRRPPQPVNPVPSERVQDAITPRASLRPVGRPAFQPEMKSQSAAIAPAAAPVSVAAAAPIEPTIETDVVSADDENGTIALDVVPRAVEAPVNEPHAPAAAEPEPLPVVVPAAPSVVEVPAVPDLPSDDVTPEPEVNRPPAKPPSVEEIFAQAFAQDQYVQGAKDKPGFEKKS